MTATWLAWLKAKWALINTRRLATAFASGRESASRAQAFGLVSRIIVRRVGGGSRPGDCQPLSLSVSSSSRSSMKERCPTIRGFGIMIGSVDVIHLAAQQSQHTLHPLPRRSTNNNEDCTGRITDRRMTDS
jgi:hypothetical protein